MIQDICYFHESAAAIPDGYCLPFRLALPNANSGARFGGKSPEGVVPPNETSRYLMTLPVLRDADLEASIFFDFEIDFVVKNKYKIFTASENFLHVVIHKNSERRKDNLFQSTVSGNRVIIQRIVPDVGSEGDSYYDNHKIGGSPFLVREDMFKSGIDALAQCGYKNWVQLDVPGFGEEGDEDGLDGDWPFADGIFNIMIKHGNESDFVYFWQL